MLFILLLSPAVLRAAPATQYNIEIRARFKLSEYMSRFKWIKPGKLVIPLPMNTYCQRFVSLQSTPGYSRIITKGRHVAALYDFKHGFPRHLAIRLRAKTRETVHTPRRLRRFAVHEGRPGFFANFRSGWYDLGDPGLKRLARTLAAGAPDLLTLSRRIKRWTGKNISYAWPWPNPPYKRTSQVLEKKRGHCVHYSALFIALHRLNGIPARMITGFYVSVGSKKGIVKDHSVAEIWDPGAKRWFYTEPQNWYGYGRNNPGHILLTSEFMGGHPLAGELPRISLYHMRYVALDGKMTYTLSKTATGPFPREKYLPAVTRWVPASGKHYRLRTAYAGKYLEASAPGGKPVLYQGDHHPKTGQLYTFLQAGKGLYSIRSALSGLCLESTDSFRENSVPPFLTPYRKKESQKFLIIRRPGGGISVLSALTFRALSLKYNSPHPGLPVFLDRYHTQGRQVFHPEISKTPLNRLRANQLAHDGSIAVRNSDLRQAESLYRQALALDPGSGYLNLEYGTFLYRDKKKYSNAIPFLGKAVRLLPENIPARYMLGFSYEKKGNYSSSLAAYAGANLLARKKGESLPLWVYLHHASLMRAHRNKPETALTILAGVPQNYRNNIHTLIQIALCRSDMPDPTEAITAYDTVFSFYKKRGKKAPSWIYRHFAYRLQERYNRPRTAIRYLSLGMADHPDAPYLLMQKGYCLQDLKQYNQAVHCYRKALEKWRAIGKKPAAHYYIRLADILRKHMKQPQEALKHLRNARSIHGTEPAILFHIGFCLDDMGKHREAVAHYKKCRILYRTLGKKEPAWLEGRIRWSIKKAGMN